MRKVIAVVLVLLLASMLIVFARQRTQPSIPVTVSSSSTVSTAAPKRSEPSPAQTVAPVQDDIAASDSDGPAVVADSEDDEPVAQSNDHVFRIGPDGVLIKDQHTRLNLEAVLARTDAGHWEQAKQQATEVLPREAAAEARDLMQKFRDYDEAQRQAYPPDQAPSTEEEALAQIEGLHALREAHFGADTARAFYAKDEETARRLLELMRREKDQSLTMEEKAVRAQQQYDARPDQP
jgi:hypothetical protein